MNYRHIYHAGNFADIFKHWILTLLLQKFLEKPAPFFILDTHAGIGIYDLQHENSQKTLEQESGILKIIDKKLSTDFAAYLRIIASLNSSTDLQYYPGSPYICQDFLRVGDRLVLNELHPEDFNTLQQTFAHDPHITLAQQDGYATIKALLPPREGRGLIFIDPPFEDPDEFANIITALEIGLKRFAHGMYAIWYPIKDRKAVKRFYSQIAELKIEKYLVVELHANQQVLNQLSSCGMVIINPPWQLDTKLRNNLPKLLGLLDFEHGNYLVEFNER